MRACARPAGALVAVIAGVTLVACDRNDDHGTRQVGVIVAAIRDAADDSASVGGSTEVDDDRLPVIYVVGGGERGVPATVQADVAERLHDEVDVRFADERSEAIKAGEPDRPVQDSGVLLVIAEIPDGSRSVNVPIEIYRSEIDTASYVFTFGYARDEWRLTATSVVPTAA